MTNPLQKHRSKTAGSSLIELIIVTVLFAIFVPISLGIFIGGRKITGQSYIQHAAALALTETTDILEYMRNENFSLLENGSFYLIRNPGNNSWLIKSDLPDKDVFERYITVSNALRHGDGGHEDSGYGEIQCITTNNVNMYIPYSPSTSGTYPTKGTTSDSATVTQSSPIVNGYLLVNLNFSGIPENFGNVVLSITFDDLDLHPQVDSSGGNQIRLIETMILMDEDSNVLTVLNDSYSETNSLFTWQRDIPDDLLGDSTLHLIIKFTSTITLINGTSYTVGNGRDDIKNIQICGQIIDPTISYCNEGDDCSNNLYLDGDVGPSYEDPNTKKVEIQMLWAPDYLPLTMISRTFYISNWQSDFTFPSS